VPFPQGSLGDKNGISVSGAPACGFGLTENNGRFLIHREMQVSGEREYPFTVLLDPGEEEWTRFKSNGALLMLALSRSETFELLRRNPISLNAERLTRALADLTLPSLPLLTSESVEGELALFLLPDRIQSANPVCLRLADIGSTERPNWEAMAQLLEHLPPAFRTVSWASGCPRATARLFGCRIVFDDPMQTEPPPGLDSLRPEGLRRWRLLQRRREVTEACGWDGDRLHRAVDQWEIGAGSFFQAMETVLELLEAGELTGALLQRANAAADAAPEFSRAIHDIIDRLDDRSEKKYSREETLRHLQTTRRVTEKMSRKLHPLGAADWLTENRIPPSRLPAIIRMPQDAILEASRRYLSGSLTDFNRRYAEVCRAFTEHISEPALEAPVREALKDFLRPPVPWLELLQIDERHRAVLWPLVSLALKRAIENMESVWFAGYLWALEDKGAKRLFELEEKRGTRLTEAANGIFKIFRQTLGGATSESLRQKAREWLESLATSEARLLIPVSVKLEIAKHVRGPWEPLLLLDSVMRSPRLRVKQVPPDTIPYLDEEAIELWRQVRGVTTDLIALRVQLANLLGRVPLRLDSEIPMVSAASEPPQENWSHVPLESYGRQEGGLLGFFGGGNREQPEWIAIAKGSFEGKYRRFVEWHRGLPPKKLDDFERELLTPSHEEDVAELLSDPRILHFLCAVTRSPRIRQGLLKIYSERRFSEFRVLAIEVLDSGLHGPYNRHSLFEALAKFVTGNRANAETLLPPLAEKTGIPPQELEVRLEEAAKA
jgi:hypothetical protein